MLFRFRSQETGYKKRGYHRQATSSFELDQSYDLPEDADDLHEMLGDEPLHPETE
ncbi:hypothetical protein [Paenibacillus sp. GP183]|uniref:hypothetical protein n=1 Tax=Paenibacillus sp. GP183 TaxID=1882751 RepID=UPI00089D679D|nr:hypothetical protein [Paenibacillus sp. GP183]SEB45956.1 hypothetical protein SAMN05443246_0471 [Paenibacillus sp. GP183]